MNRKLSPSWTLAILTGLNLFNYMDRFILNAVRTPMADSFGINYEASGRVFTAFMIGYFITSPFFGYLGDRVSRKWLIAVGIFVWSLGTVLTGFAGTFALLLGCRVLVGVGEASYATISPGLISDSFGPARRNNALTIFYVARSCGQARRDSFWLWFSCLLKILNADRLMRFRELPRPNRAFKIF
jgi:MFS family permease